MPECPGFQIFFPENLLRDSSLCEQIGGKARGLLTLNQLQLPVPVWFVVVPTQFGTSSSEEMLLSALAKLQSQCPPATGHPTLFAVRSSAQEEDGTKTSYAGIYHSELAVSKDHISAALKQVWASAFQESCQTYSTLQKQTDEGHPLSLPAIVVQHMIFPTLSGVAFGRDPISGNPNKRVISSLYGQGSLLVSGEISAETLYCSPNGNIENKTPLQQSHGLFLTTRADGTHTLEKQAVPPTPQEEILQKTILDEPIRHYIVQVLNHLEQVLGQAQDIEWAIENGTFYLLQTRPITTGKQEGLSNEIPVEYDNNCVAEFLNGLILPLTHSFHRQWIGSIYAHSLSQTSDLHPHFEQMKPLFNDLLTLHRGQVYLNSSLMNRLWQYAPSPLMMLEAFLQFARHPKQLSWKEHARFTQRVLKQLLSVWKKWQTLPQQRKQFYVGLNQLLTELQLDWQKIPTPLLVELMKRTLHQAKALWAFPALVDFYSTLFYQAVEWSSHQWLPVEHSRSWMTQLLEDTEHSEAQQQFAHLQQLVHSVISSPGLLEAFQQGHPEQIETLLEAYPECKQKYHHYLHHYGCETEADAKLESIPLWANSTPLCHRIALMAQMQQRQGETLKSKPDDRLSRKQGVWRQVELALGPHAFKRIALAWLYQKTILTSRWKQSLKTPFAHIMDRFRQMTWTLAQRLQDANLIETAGDIHFLSLEEAWDAVTHTSPLNSLKARIAERKQAYQVYIAELQQQKILPNQFTCAHWASEPENSPPSSNTTLEHIRDGYCKGEPASAGKRQGEIYWLNAIDTLQQTDYRQFEGKILVAQRSDPALVTLFPFIQGLIVEQGSPLSHPAIVARELSLPMLITHCPLASWLQNGDWVTFDGGTGELQKITPVSH